MKKIGLNNAIFFFKTFKMKSIINAFSLLLIFAVYSHAQNYPVDINVLVLPPHAPAYHTFSQSSMMQSNKMQVTMTLKDLVVDQLDIGLQVEFHGESGSFVSDPALIYQPFTLNKGMPKIINNQDLAPYFLSNGLSEAVVANGGFLPEGDWEICVTAYELLNQEQVSQQTCYYLFLEQFDPPEILLPQDSILPQFPQNVQLLWQPLHIGAFPVQYELEVWESLDGYTDQQIIESTLPYYSKTLDQVTTTFWNVTDPPLMVGQEYVMRVRIMDNVNGSMGEPVYDFKNQGYSNIHRFKYGMSIPGEECEDVSNPEYVIDDSLNTFIYWDGGKPPTYNYQAPQQSNNFSTTLGNAESTSLLSSSGGIGPTGQGGGSSSSESSDNSISFSGYYKVYVRDVTDGILGEWVVYETESKWIPFDDYIRGHSYEVYISKVCSAEERHSESIFIDIPTLPQTRDYECGLPSLPIDLENEEPLAILNIGDTIIASDFRVSISEVSGNDGYYSGKGAFQTGFFGAAVEVEFTDIFVNSEYRLVDGFIQTTWDPEGSFMFNLDSLFASFNSGGGPKFPTIEVDYTDSVTIENGLVVVYPDGDTYDMPVYITSPQGNYLGIAGMSLPQGEKPKPSIISNDYQVIFESQSRYKYGLDNIDQNFEKYYVKFDGEAIPHKSVAYLGKDKLDARISVSSTNWKASDWDSVKVVTADGFILEYDRKSGDSKVIEIWVPGLDKDQNIYVMYGEECMGVFSAQVFEFTNLTVNLIPVNGAGKDVDVDLIENQLNKILGQGVFGVTLNLKLDEEITAEAEELSGERYGLKNYKEDMLEILKEHKELYGQDRNEMYLFIHPNLKDNVVGYMPIGYNAGFIEYTNNSNDLAVRMAHELGHGALTFEHYFNDVDVSEESSNNLMDYRGGTELNYFQWMRMHNRKPIKSWFQGSDDAQLHIGDSKIACLTVDEISNMNLGLTFYDGNRKAFNIPATAVPRSYYRADNEESLQGVLHSFVDGNQIWALHHYVGTTDFAGYAPTSDSDNRPWQDRKFKYDNVETIGQKVIIDHVAKTAIIKSGDSSSDPILNISCDCPLGNGTGFGKSNVIDYTQTITQEAIDKAISDLNETQKSTGVDVSLYIIDHNTSDSIRTIIQDRIDNLTGDSYIVRLEFENDTDYKPIDIYYGISYDSRTFNEFLNEAIADSKLATKVSLDLLTDFLDGLAHIVKNLTVPERFYNPEHQKYKPYLANIYRVSSYLNPTSYANNVILNDLPNKGDYESFQIEFAFTVGIYNGLINQVGDLVELPSILIKLVTNEDGLRDTMLLSFEQFSKDCEEADKNLGGCAFEKIWSLIVKAHGGSNSCLLAHQVGKDVSELATFFLAFSKIGKLGKLGKASQLMEKLDATTYIIKGGGALLKFSVAAGKTTFRFGKSTLVLVATISETGVVTGWKILKEIGGEVEQIINKGLDEFLPSKNLATVQINNRIYLGASDVKDWKVNELLSDAQTQLQDDFGNYLVEIKKIGNDGIEESKLIMAKVIELDEFYKFLKEKEGDLEFVNYLSSLDKKIKQSLNVDLKDPEFRGWLKSVDDVNSWDFVKRAVGPGSSKPLSTDILETVSKYLGNEEFLKFVGGGKIDDGKKAFGDLIKNYAGKCSSCTGGNPSAYLPDKPQDFVDKVAKLSKRYSDKNGIDIFNEAKKGYSSQEGLWHAMEHLDAIDPKTVKKIDAKFEGQGLPCAGCRFDVELIPTSTNPLKLIEYKSYADASRIPLKQFKNYLNDVTDLNQFNYIFSKSKLNLSVAQDGIKNFLKNNADELFKDIPDGGVGIDKMKQLFEIPPNIRFANASQFKSLLENNSQFRAKALSFVKTD